MSDGANDAESRRVGSLLSGVACVFEVIAALEEASQELYGLGPVYSTSWVCARESNYLPVCAPQKAD